MKLDLGCGSRKAEGFLGVDISAECGADIVHDLRVYPWPFADDSVDEVRCSHFLEHLTGEERMKFMDELWRVMKPGATALIVTPYWQSYGAVQDPTHQWPPICEASYFYFNRAWRETAGVAHYPIRCDFDLNYGFWLGPDWRDKPQQEKGFALRHYCNVAQDLHATLKKRA
ncbi:MAG: class I SAM-dependent methyltransferase [Rhodanobacteraceae bacterium]|nr:class I SAM-dependent methyltransferase [Rhodanobacteraceae bacterium]